MIYVMFHALTMTSILVSSETCHEYLSSSSCYNTEISDLSIYCYGHRSCYSSELSAISTVNCGGLYGCYYAQDITSSSGSILCDGDHGCYMAQSIKAGSSISCNGDYGCYRVDTIESQTGNIQCNGNYGCCYSKSIKSISGSIHCNGAYGCYRIEEIIQSDQSIYCGGNYGCGYSGGIQSLSGSIYCDGTYGCYYSQGQIEASQGNIYCDGEYGCYNAQGGISAKNIHCSGEYGCYNAANISASLFVYCDGKYGCYKVIGTISGLNIYASGNRGAYYSNINAVSDVQCGGSYSCYYASITSGNDVIISGNFAAYGSNIISTGDVSCDASFSCSYSSISTGGKIEILGSRSGYYSSLTAKTIIVYGYYGLSYSDITSYIDDTLTVSLYGYYAGYQLHIYCLEGSVCTIRCHSDRSCYLTRIYYHEIQDIEIYPSTCIDDGDGGMRFAGISNDDGIYCPYLISSTDAALKSKFKLKRTQEREADNAYTQFEQEIGDELAKEESERKSDDEKREAKFIQAEKDRQEGVEKDEQNTANLHVHHQNIHKESIASSLKIGDLLKKNTKFNKANNDHYKEENDDSMEPDNDYNDSEAISQLNLNKYTSITPLSSHPWIPKVISDSIYGIVFGGLFYSVFVIMWCYYKKCHPNHKNERYQSLV